MRRRIVVKIVAALAFYDEPVPFLTRCVESLAGVADELVAFDGAWDMFDGGPQSDETQWTAITTAADNAGIDLGIYAPDTTWASQVEKRAALMLECRNRSADWTLVIDGDEWVAHKDHLRFRSELFREVGRDVAQVGCVRLQRDPAMTDTRPSPIRRVYRASMGVTVDTAHNGYRTADGRWLHGDPAYVELESPLDLSRWLVLHHEASSRGGDRDARRLAYRRRRRELGLETWRGRVAA